VREDAVAAKPGDGGDLGALEGQDEHSVRPRDLRLIATKTVGDGLAHLTYERAREA
jgi:hypothetical protein